VTLVAQTSFFPMVQEAKKRSDCLQTAARASTPMHIRGLDNDDRQGKEGGLQKLCKVHGFLFERVQQSILYKRMDRCIESN
jgi:hypothetical protein